MAFVWSERRSFGTYNRDQALSDREKKMPESHKSRLSRREFLALMGGAASVATLGACSSPTPVVVTATPTAVPPSPTPEPSPTPAVVVEPAGFEMVLVEAGSFEMGSAGGRSAEQPVHTVNISRPFYIGKYEVTCEQYSKFDSGAGSGNLPVGVIWYDAVEYCNWLSEQAGLTPCYELARVATTCDFSVDGYRLPTEAEWEYAARGGPRSQGYVYAGSDDPDEVAWFAENSDGQPHPVGQKKSNELGLYDMSGNLNEWCWDWYTRDYYASSLSGDPTGPKLASTSYQHAIKVFRGGCFMGDASAMRVSGRNYAAPDYFGGIGDAIRLVRTA
jgi:formylglycine-generating enzyme required for sulfatase activity